MAAFEIVALDTATPQLRAPASGDTYVAPRDMAVSANFSVTGNTTLGDASTDTVTVNGYMGVGGAPNSAVGLRVGYAFSSGTSLYGLAGAPIGPAGNTSFLIGVSGAPATNASAFTATNTIGLYAPDHTKGAGSTITNAHGLYIGDQTQGTNNYGITSLVSSGTNKWNIYASGTAANYFAGNVLLGTTTTTNNVPSGATATLASVIKGDGVYGGPTFTAYAGTNVPTTRGNIVYFSRSRGTTDGSMTAVADGDALGRLVFRGSNDTAFLGAASIEASVGGTVSGGGADDMPGRLTFHTSADGTSNLAERLRITSDGYVRLASGSLGIQFNGDTAAANALDDYEEGTFTPTIEGTTTAGTGTYTTQIGRYTKIGNRVMFTISLSWSAHTGTGDMQVSGLPFITEGTTGNLPTYTMYSSSLAFTSGNILQSTTSPGSTVVLLRQVPTGGGSPVGIPIDTAVTTFIISGHYQT